MKKIILKYSFFFALITASLSSVPANAQICSQVGFPGGNCNYPNHVLDCMNFCIQSGCLGSFQCKQIFWNIGRCICYNTI